MPAKERDRIIQTFRHGGIRCLTSVNVLSIGFNVPHVDLVALLRPTESAGLYIQQVGRAFRKAPGKTDALILDFSGNVRKHGPVDAVSAPGGPKGKGDGEGKAEPEVRAKACPKCESLVPNRVMQCPDCGHEWTSEPKHDTRPDEVDILSGRDRDGWTPVRDVSYYRHVKRGAPMAPPSLRVTYGIGVMAINAWFFFSHPQGSIPQRKAASFWLEAGGLIPSPASVDEALARQGELRAPEAIRYRKSESGFNEVTGRRYARKEVAA
jgi:DNA repair protein RadD